jgi:hypothetical protein
MQQTSGSSVSNRTDGESAVDEVVVVEVAVDEDEGSVVVVSFLLILLMVCGNCDRSICLK